MPLPNTKPRLIALSISTLLAAACSSDGTEQSPATYTLRGTVPGTLIEAFCDNGSYFSTHSDHSVSTPEHPFDLELPVGVACRLVMTTGEGTANALVTPIGFINTDTFSIAFEGSEDVDIGYIPLQMQQDPGCSMTPPAPTYDLDCNGIQDAPIFIQVEIEDLEVIVQAVDPLDDDRDYLVDAYEDDDNDGIPNIRDDNSGTNDNDGDGIENGDDVDDDNDGQNDDEDEDDDNDGLTDDEDRDDDNDGIDDIFDEDHEDHENDGHDEEEDEDHDEDDDREDHDEDEGDDHENEEGDEAEEDEDEGEGNGSASNFTNDEPTAGRLLVATQCAQCHGTDGYSVTGIDSIGGESRSEILEETVEDADEPEDLMGFHGSVYINLYPELESIADYLSAN
jgi:hypothetical protein